MDLPRVGYLVLALVLVLGSAPGVTSGQPASKPTRASADGAKTLDALAASGVDRTVIVGIPTQAELNQVRLASLTVIDQTERDRQTRTHPLIEGRARLLFASMESKPSDRRHEADRAARFLADTPLATTAAEGLRRTSLAAAHWLAGRKPTDETGSGDTALGILESVLDLPVGDDAVQTLPRGVRAEAMGLMVLMTQGPQRDAALQAMRTAVFGGNLALQGRTDPAMELFLAEVEARAQFEKADEREPIKPDLTRAFDRLLELAARDAQSMAEPLCPPAIAKIAAAAKRAGADPSTLPAPIAMAWARATLAEVPTNPPAQAVLTRTSESANPAHAAAALWWLGVSAEQAQGRTGADQAWLQLEQRFPDDPRAIEGLRRAAKAHEKLPPDSRRHWGQLRQAESWPQVLLVEALIRRMGADPRSADWRIELVSALDPEDTPRRLRLLREAAEVPGAGRAAAEADECAERLVKPYMSWERWPSIIAAPTDDKTGLRQTVEAALDWAQRRKPAAVPRLQLAAATLHTLEKHTRDDGFRSLMNLIDRSPPVEPRIRAEAAIRAAKVQRETGKPSEGFALLGRIAEELDRVPAGQARPPEFWQLWSEMLAVMAEENKAGERSADIRLRIRQLETVDPKLGGGDAATRIKEIERLLQ